MNLTSEHVEIALRLVLALLLGALIGLERSYHGRPAGFRTHALVCLSTCLLMLVTAYERAWLPRDSHMNLTLDPTRMAQGIMTGIGFLGAGTIIKDGVSVRGLTTAASIWVTAAVGVMVGIGFYWPGVIAATLVLGTLSAFRFVERRIPSQFYAQLTVRFVAQAMPDERDLRALLRDEGFRVANLSYRVDDDGVPAGARAYEYRMSVNSRRADQANTLAQRLSRQASVSRFEILPIGD